MVVEEEEEERRRRNEGRLTRCVWAVSPRHQLEDGEIEGVCTRARARALYAPTRIVHCCVGRRAGGLAKMATVYEARRGEAGKRQKNGEAGQRAPRVFSGPRQLTSDGRKSFYVFIRARSFLFPSPRRFQGIDRTIRKLLRFLRDGEPNIPINISDSKKSWREFDDGRTSLL